MKSKKSYFNPTIYKKNLAISWPVWVLYLLSLIMAGPLYLVLAFSRADKYYMYPAASKMTYLSECLSPQLPLWIIFITSMIVAILVFGYLNNSRSANMIHSLPVSRSELMLTNVLSGLTMLIVPLVITFILDMVVCMSFHVTAFFNILVWLLYAMGFAFLFFSLATFCAFLAGHGVAIVFYYFLLNFLYVIIHFIVSLLIGFFSYGVDTNAALSEGRMLEALSPLVFISNRIGSQLDYVGDSNVIVGFHLYGGNAVWPYVFVAIAFFVISWLIYKRRKIELAGDMVAIPVIRPVMRWLIGIVAGCLLGYLGYSFFVMAGLYIGVAGMLILMLIIGFIGYMATQMVIRKSFRVFNKKFWLEGLGFMAGLGVLFGGCAITGHFMERYIPAADEIKEAIISSDYPLFLYGEDVSIARDLQKDLIDHKSEFYKVEMEEGTFEYAPNTIYICYILNDGTYIERNYLVEINDGSAPIFERLSKIEWSEDYFINNFLGASREITGVEFEDFDVSQDEYGDYSSDFTYIEVENFLALFKAIVEDAREGNLQCYHAGATTSDEYEFDNNYYMENLVIEYKLNPEEINEYYYDYYMDGENYYRNVYITFGPKCTNIINELINQGLIDSEYDLYTNERYYGLDEGKYE